MDLPNPAMDKWQLNFITYGIYSPETMSNLASLTSAQLKRAAGLKDQINRLEVELSNLFNVPSKPVPAPKKSRLSAAARAKIAAAQKARWAKIKNASPARVVRKNSKISAAGRAKIAAAARARWAKAKAAGKNKL